MSLVIFYKLLAIFVTVAIGWVAGRLRWLGTGDPARTLSSAALYIFIPALLFRTTARTDLASLPWRTIAAYFVPTVALMLAVYIAGRYRPDARRMSAAPSVRALSVGFGNTVQIGIPMASALFGEAGLGIHMMIISVHALILLVVMTTLVELDLARDHARRSGVATSLSRTLATTLRNTVIHPVVLPVVVGLAWHLFGLPLPAVFDEVLVVLGSAVVPLCLVLIGMSLAVYGLQGDMRAALASSALKLLVLPALVLAVAHWAFALDGLPLAVLVMVACLPTGSNALIFSQRYTTLEAETTAVTVFSTIAFVATAPLWLTALHALGAL